MTTDAHKAKIKAIGAMFVPGSFPAQPAEGTEKQLLDLYLMAVEDIPADFVAMACKRFIQGQVERKSIQFRPSPPELAVEARRLRDKALELQRYDTARLPKPKHPDFPIPTSEERERTRDLWAEARAEIHACVESLVLPKGKRFAYRQPTLDELIESRDRIAAWEQEQQR